MDEIVDAVLDAADVEILEGVGDGPLDPATRMAGESGELLRLLLLDLLERYQERRRREARSLLSIRIQPERRESCGI